MSKIGFSKMYMIPARIWDTIQPYTSEIQLRALYHLNKMNPRNPRATVPTINELASESISPIEPACEDEDDSTASPPQTQTSVENINIPKIAEEIVQQRTEESNAPIPTSPPRPVTTPQGVSFAASTSPPRSPTAEVNKPRTPISTPKSPRDWRDYYIPGNSPGPSQPIASSISRSSPQLGTPYSLMSRGTTYKTNPLNKPYYTPRSALRNRMVTPVNTPVRERSPVNSPTKERTLVNSPVKYQKPRVERDIFIPDNDIPQQQGMDISRRASVSSRAEIMSDIEENEGSNGRMLWNLQKMVVKAIDFTMFVLCLHAFKILHL